MKASDSPIVTAVRSHQNQVMISVLVYKKQQKYVYVMVIMKEHVVKKYVKLFCRSKEKGDSRSYVHGLDDKFYHELNSVVFGCNT